MTTLQETDLILDVNNIYEIKDKILYALQSPNSVRLLSGINPDTTSIEYRQAELLSLVKALGNIKH